MPRVCIINRPLSAAAARDPVRSEYDRRDAPFRSTWTATQKLLADELEWLGVEDAVLEVDVEESGIRADGSVKLNARWASPRVALAFTLPAAFEWRGGKRVETAPATPLRYPCDRFTSWQDNIRAIALGLEALRKLDRYGITSSRQQYTGWKQIPAATGPTLTVATAAAFLGARADVPATAILTDKTLARDVLRKEMANAHPDAGGSVEVWHTIQAARDLLAAHHGGTL